MTPFVSWKLTPCRRRHETPSRWSCYTCLGMILSGFPRVVAFVCSLNTKQTRYLVLSQRPKILDLGVRSGHRCSWRAGEASPKLPWISTGYWVPDAYAVSVCAVSKDCWNCVHGKLATADASVRWCVIPSRALPMQLEPEIVGIRFAAGICKGAEMARLDLALYLILWRCVLSCPVVAFPFLSFPFLSRPIPSHPILSHCVSKSS